jgi:hypothetical protein
MHGRNEKCITTFCLGNLIERDHFGDQAILGEDIKYDLRVSTGFNCFMIGFSGSLS